MRVLLDTNILTRLAQPGHHHHAKASQALEIMRRRSDDLCLVPQVLYEFWVVCTRPPGENGLGMTVSEAGVEFTRIKRLFVLFRDERAIFQKWETLVGSHAVRGKSAHDARLVAAMLRHGLTHILTFNAADFARFSGIEVASPDQIIELA